MWAKPPGHQRKSPIHNWQVSEYTCQSLPSDIPLVITQAYLLNYILQSYQQSEGNSYSEYQKIHYDMSLAMKSFFFL